MFWPRLSTEEINTRIDHALNRNTPFSKNSIFGLPGSWLNRKVFPSVEFLNEAPFLRAMQENPNHIGCHTSGRSETFFEGTQEIEREALKICAEEILQAEPNSYDGYVASGGTEGNIQALWIYRNYFRSEKNANTNQIAVLFSQDTHYSIYKACNLLNLNGLELPVEEVTRQIDRNKAQNLIAQATNNGIKYFIAVLNMGTTMFGSVDDLTNFQHIVHKSQIDCMIHIDAAFGGFIHPFSSLNHLTFKCPAICSFSLDGHKLLQAPYGTGVFLVRRPFIQYVQTEKASYVNGFDQTLCGSRSGAHAIALWMILHSYGSNGWGKFILELLEKTDKLSSGLSEYGVKYFRQPNMNIITISNNAIPKKLLKKYHWIADSEEDPHNYKAVIMDHVSKLHISIFLSELAELY